MMKAVENSDLGIQRYVVYCVEMLKDGTEEWAKVIRGLDNAVAYANEVKDGFTGRNTTVRMFKLGKEVKLEEEVIEEPQPPIVKKKLKVVGDAPPSKHQEAVRNAVLRGYEKEPCPGCSQLMLVRSGSIKVCGNCQWCNNPKGLTRIHKRTHSFGNLAAVVDGPRHMVCNINLDWISYNCPCGASVSGRYEADSIDQWLRQHRSHTDDKILHHVTKDGMRAYGNKIVPDKLKDFQDALDES